MDKIYSISIENNTSHKIDFYAARNGMEHVYSDTLINSTPIVRTVVSNSSASIAYSSIPWSVEFKKLPKNTLSIYIFEADTISKYPWQVIRDDYKILKRYDLSIKDLEMLDYKIPYPENTKMQKIKMYPKYGH